MYIISYKIPFESLDSTIELLQINDIFNVFYENPLEITTDNYGYGYVEKQVDDIILKIVFDDDSSLLDKFIAKLHSLLNIEYINIEENTFDYTTYDFPAIHLDETWVIASPDDIFENKKKIDFISQGAFGTGLHETTQDILRLILNNLQLTGKSVLDIGTGSGILSIAASISGAKSIVANDIRDIQDEVELNASLNNLKNITVSVGNILEDPTLITDTFDWIFINIGGEETKLFMDFIKSHIKSNGNLLVSGLVEWSFEEVKSYVEKYDFKLVNKYQSNEWVTAIFSL